MNICDRASPGSGPREHRTATHRSPSVQGSRPPSHCDGGSACSAEGGAACSGEDGTSSSEEVDTWTGSSPSHAFGAVGPWEPTAQLCLTHFYVDVQHAEDSTYEIEERHIPIDPTFHAHLQDHQEDNISNFLALPEVIRAIKRKRAQPLLDFSKSKILTSLAYIEACEQLLAQRSAHEAEAKRKGAKREATRESRLKAKEERQRQV